LTKPIKQHAIAPAYTSKISKAFLDALYAFLDGLVQLASDQSPAARRAAIGENETPGSIPKSTAGVWSNRLELLDLSAGVRAASDFDSAGPNVSPQDTRLLLVLSNLATLMKTLIPRMMKQLETAFGISIDDDRSVRFQSSFISSMWSLTTRTYYVEASKRRS
jgi:exocyst complex component 2